MAVPWDTFEPAPPGPYKYSGGVRIATLNAYFLFDGVGDEGEADFAHKGDSLASLLHRRKVGSVLRTLDADVVILQEVENQRALDLLIEESLDGLGYYGFLVDGQDSFTGQDVALLSRLPVDGVERTDILSRTAPNMSLQNVSKNLIVRMDLVGIPTTLIGVHLLARPSDPMRKDQREAQAEVLRMVVEQEVRAGRSVVVLGDFNDFDGEIPDVAENRPITDVLARIRSAGPGKLDDLYNVLKDVPRSQRFTAHWDRNENELVEAEELSAIDHILLSEALYRRVREVRFVHGHDPLAVTDHFPIVVVLATGE